MDLRDVSIGKRSSQLFVAQISRPVAPTDFGHYSPENRTIAILDMWTESVSVMLEIRPAFLFTLVFRPESSEVAKSAWALSAGIPHRDPGEAPNLHPPSGRRQPEESQGRRGNNNPWFS